MNIPFIANHLTIQNLINCYVKETGEGEWKDINEVPIRLEDKRIKQMLVLPFERQSITLYIPVRYQSITERHLFSPIMYYQVKNDEVKQLDYITLIAFMQKEFSLQSGDPVQADELMLRTILSYQNMKRIISDRSNSLQECYQKEKTFLQSEQSLLIGHQVHPTPKSRQGIDEDEEAIFAPERKGAFQLHYFRAAKTIVEEGSVLPQNATMLIKEELKKDPFVSQSFKENYCQEDGFSLIPVHPLQARKLLGKEEVCHQIQSEKLSYLGPQGRRFYPTSSVRTVYHPEANFMYKFSIPVKITNSLRVNKRKELERGVEVSRLLQSELHDRLSVLHPGFRIIQDPAYMTLNLGVEETGFETVIRENPFQEGNDSQTTLLAALCQDHITGEGSHLTNIISAIASQEGISLEKASERWFARYLKISLQPLYWLYSSYGIALEAHQQNSIIRLDEKGYPDIFYYRDNQGYYFMESKASDLKQLVPTLNEKSDTICADSVAEERFRYYFFFNHLFGLINAFGANRLIGEQHLLFMLKEELKDLKKHAGDHTNLLDSLLYEEKLPCKANLLTRVHDMDELVGSLATQSVYVHVTNPLTVNAGELNEV
ncbi:IucA/IucC family protein [Niallia endozanthoxylica]|uniref:IucA/IucC family siderophore biosynthesis protein n=1 Tax=Niallia endozanthoxylica TaxID=2036016 RepID=A0A5J5I5F2_9BACI|nr:IucA/IucC family siderophore biosynthesis protein [Niallia endozanthoxylica]KAA9030679.1 IucA/IucC family siderophore biosynthesis protein [Niallia endozanthoxylica]